MKYTNSLTPYDGELQPSIREAIFEISKHFAIADVKVLKLDDDNIAIPIDIPVELPQLGTVNGIDIRDIEPIYLKLHLHRYPHIAPSVWSDRKDFPKKRLSHLYASAKGEPVSMCLVRGNPNEWFSNKRMSDFLTVVEEWFYKAATGKLNSDNGEFDPLRLDRYTGHHIYRYELAYELINTKVPFFKGYSCSCMLSFDASYIKDDERKTIFKSVLAFPSALVATMPELLKSFSNNSLKPLLSLVIWHPNDTIETEYSTDFPTNFAELKTYFSRIDVDIATIVDLYRGAGLPNNEYIPIVHAIRRPNKVIGFPGDLEFLNLLLKPEVKKGRISDSSVVKYQSHIEPFSTRLAEQLTKEIRDARTLFIGAGSLGSRIILHDARTGKKDIGICDDDTFLQHNLVRHPLFDNHVGDNKASSIIDELKNLYRGDTGVNFKAGATKVTNIDDDEYKKYDWLVDTTASFNVQNWLAVKSLPTSLNIARCELMNEGKLGMLYIEGVNRNPRIDDLVNLAYYNAAFVKEIAEWRKRDALIDTETIEIGLGCSSTTTVMADDTIAYHASLYSRLLQNEKSRTLTKGKGLIYMSKLNMEGMPVPTADFKIIDPFDVLYSQGEERWEIRCVPAVSQKLLSLCKKYKPRETGGILIGVCNYKTKTIHIFEAIEEPKDSKGTRTGFERGTDGLPKIVDTFKAITGGIIGYVGEWHSHPMDLESLSTTDKSTINDLVPINSKTPIPTLSVIVTNKKIIPFLYHTKIK